MDHVAILKPSWKLLPKILSGEKYIESRWYQHRVAPWNKLTAGDSIFFKDSGQPITVKATVSRVLQFDELTSETVADIIAKYNQGIRLVHPENKDWFAKKRYCILIFLENPQPVTPFHIDKTGFGNAAAWLVVGKISRVKL